MLEQMISQKKTLKMKYFLPFNFGITEIHVVIHLAEDRARMGDRWLQQSPNCIVNVMK